MHLQRALAAATARHPHAADWLAAAAGRSPVAPEGDWDEAWATASDALWTRGTGVGQVFTPRRHAAELLDALGYHGGSILDPACGGGVFLVAAAERHPDPARILADVRGIDLDPACAALARLALAEVALRRGAAPDTLPDVSCADALTTDIGPVRYVVGNPPFLESKGRDPAFTARLRRRFPGLHGAFDLYAAFLELALELAPEAIAYVLPNKFLVARYGESLRARLVGAWGPAAMLDWSAEPVFARVGVYPVGIVLRPATVCVSPGRGEVPVDVLREAGVWFPPPPGPLAGLLRLLRGPRLAEHVEVRTTVSFHARGLRERYVGDEGLPYLGGSSWQRALEIEPFRVRWAGARIRYATEELAALGNPLPPFSLFARPKVIFAQHARRLIAAADPDGTYVTKDTYPVAYGPDPHDLAALFNSRLYSVLYRLLHGGIAISSGYLHFLPRMLGRLPWIDPAGLPQEQAALDAEVARRAGLTGEEEEAVGATSPTHAGTAG